MTSEKGRIRKLERELAQRDHTILKLQNSINDLTRQIENLTEIILQMRRDKFGPSSEKTRKADDGGEQLSLFNEAEWRRILSFRNHSSRMRKVRSHLAGRESAGT